MAGIFRRQKIDVEELQKELLEKEEEIKQLNDFKNSLFQDLNIIHLYAALSEEETQVEGLKEKQKIIMDVCDKLIQQLN